MKRKIPLFLMAALMVLSLSACGDKDRHEDGTEDTKPPITDNDTRPNGTDDGLLDNDAPGTGTNDGVVNDILPDTNGDETPLEKAGDALERSMDRARDRIDDARDRMDVTRDHMEERADLHVR